MIFRLSHALNVKIKAGPVRALPLNENPFADWSAHVFIADRTQYVLLSNTKSLYSTVMYGKGITNDSNFIDRALSSIREFMDADGQEFTYRRLIAPACTSVCFARALNRSVTGSMKELILHATDWLTEGDLSPHDVGFRLNDVLLSALAKDATDQYRKPREAVTSLLSVTGNEPERKESKP